MNKFKKYCPNVWVAECDEEYEKGEIIYLETKYGKEVECKVYNLLANKNDKFYYSIVRTEDMSYAERKAEKYGNAAMRNISKSQEKWKASEEGKEFLSLGEPIKVGHHSEKRHRALLERNWNRVEKAIELEKKAEEQEAKAEEYHKKLKDNKELRTHSYSLTYAKKAVNELKKKVEIAKELWGENEE